MPYFDNPYYYDILEVDENAKEEDIITSFRQLAKEYHPDKHSTQTASKVQEVQERFKLINEAYQILKNPIMRAEYDKFLSSLTWEQVVDAEADVEDEYVYEDDINKIIIDCPNCDQCLRVVRGESLRVRCPSCNHTFAYPFKYQKWNSGGRDEDKQKKQYSNSCEWPSYNCLDEATDEYEGSYYCLKHYTSLVKKSMPEINKSLAMIRNACLAGTIYGFLGLIIGRTDVDKCFYIFMIGLSFGVYKRSRTYASALFIMVLLMVMFMMVLLAFSEEWGAWMVILIPLAPLYFFFKGMRGTFIYHRLCYEEDSNHRPASKKFYFVGLPLLIMPIVLYCSLIFVQSGVLKSKFSNSAKKIPIVTDNINKDINGENTKSKPIKLDREYQLDSDSVLIAKIYHSEGKEIYREIYDNEFSVIKRIGKIPDGMVWAYYPSGEIAEKSNYKNGKLHGVYKRYYKDGTLSSEASYKDGRSHGSYKSYNKNGKLSSESNYKDNEFHGIHKNYYDNGVLRSESNYIHGKLDGLSKKYYENGVLETESHNKDGNPIGTLKWYFPNGKIQLENYFKGGKLVGWKLYNEMGKVTEEGSEVDVPFLLKELEEITENVIEQEVFFHDWYNKGHLEFDNKEYANAITFWTKAIEMDTNSADAYGWRGLAYSSLNQNEMAIEDYNKAIELDPANVAAYQYRGFAYIVLNQFGKGIEDLSIAMKLKPDDAWAYNLRGLAYGKLKLFENAIEDFGKAIKLDTEYAEAYNRRGYVYYFLNQNDKAAEDYNKAIALEPDSVASYRNISELNIVIGNYKGALDNITKAFSFSPKIDDMVILLYLECIAMKLLGMDTYESENEFNEYIKRDFSTKWDSDMYDSWLKDADIDDDTRLYIKEKTKLIKKHTKL